jgi:oxygen-independent coproporphyrinogen-3 oxidase
MDHFALPTDELAVALKERRLWRNFQGYTVLEAPDLVGLGVTSISDLGGSFAQNNPRLEAYIQAAKSGALATYRGKDSSADDRIRRHVITHLMCNLELDVRKIEQQFDLDFWSYFSEENKQLTELANDGIIEIEANAIRVTPIGRIFVRHVGMAFDKYVRDRKAGGPRFSKTI